MSLILTWIGKTPVVRIARMGGQYAKPRSSATETVNGVQVCTFRGDSVNGIAIEGVCVSHCSIFIWIVNTQFYEANRPHTGPTETLASVLLLCSNTQPCPSIAVLGFRRLAPSRLVGSPRLVVVSRRSKSNLKERV